MEEAGDEERSRSSTFRVPGAVGDMVFLARPPPPRGVGTGAGLLLDDEVDCDVLLGEATGVGGSGLCRLSLGDLLTGCCVPEDGFAFVGSMGSCFFFPSAGMTGKADGRTFSMAGLPRDDSTLNLGALEAGTDCVNSSSLA